MSDQKVRFVRATRDADFQEKRVISSSPWEYVALWLRQNCRGAAQTYWEQARHFFDAAKELPAYSAPLPLYYSFLNATKALLEAKHQSYTAYHGISGFDMRKSPGARISLEAEGLKIKGGGILPALIRYFGEVELTRQYNLADVLANLAFVHRAYSLSYSKSELFLSIHQPRYVSAGNGQARFQACIPAEHTHGAKLNTLPPTFQHRDPAEDEIREFGRDCKILESTGTFGWSGARRATDQDIENLKVFHRGLRIDLNYISGNEPYWYVKRNLAGINRINRNNLTLIFMAMHRMSEIARYKPIELNVLLDGRRNWLIYEFIRSAQNQFVDEIAAEITGKEISPAGVRQGTF
ncbi:MAG: hypothetical protein C0457_21715 [Polymorphum sp.]|nr:hypothetical protein [Polymorphum sp.]